MFERSCLVCNNSSLRLVGNLESEEKVQNDADDYDNDQSDQSSHQLVFAFVILFVGCKKGMESPGILIVIFCHFIE